MPRPTFRSAETNSFPVHQQLDAGYVCRGDVSGRHPLGCYQMYVMDLGGKIRMVSTGSGTTTCVGTFFPGDRRCCIPPRICGAKLSSEAEA